ncbi:MAG: hypothetical protein EAZ35_09510 [Sphingobacteriia bacterium]|nr:MAG: hypothetical protein EAZ41_04700 [Sphingobacteriia bacterium]TAG29850.1 MAG: hypothetical protein EAZ35_09510 [Sphingobacteriia bacterium]
MNETYFLIEERTGICTEISEIREDFNKVQILKIVGIDSEMIPQLSAKTVDGEWITKAIIVYSKYLAIDNNEEMNIRVGNKVLKSIYREFPKLKFRFNYEEFGSKKNGSKVYPDFRSGLIDLANF